MTRPMMLGTIAMLSIAGSALGVYLGKGAIAEIDPVYFSSPPPSRFFADLTPAGYNPDTPDRAHPDDFWASELNVSGRPECFDCGNFVATAALSEPWVYVSEPPEEMHEPVAIDASVPVRPPARVQIERYAYFPVTIEEAREAAEREQEYASRDPARTRVQASAEAAPIGM